MAALESLELYGNQLESRIPPPLGALALGTSSPPKNQLEGENPPELGALQKVHDAAALWRQTEREDSRGARRHGGAGDVAALQKPA